MGQFFFSHLLAHFYFVCPSDTTRVVFVALLLLGLGLRPLPTLLGFLWAGWALSGELLLAAQPWRFRCHENFWFLCSSEKPSLWLPLFQDRWLGSLAEALRSSLKGACDAWGNPWGPLAASLLLGDRPPESLDQLYRNLGLVHVLVISGSQFTLLAKALEALLHWPLQGLYALGLLRWPLFAGLRFLLDVVQLAALAIYLLACGLSPPCQRAYLEQLQNFLLRWFYRQPAGERRWVTLRRQALLFPETFLSLSNVLSWAAVSVLQSGRGLEPVTRRLGRVLKFQLLNLSFFARFLPSSLLFDLCLTPLWDLMLYMVALGVLFPGTAVQGRVAWGLSEIHDFLFWVQQAQLKIWGSSELGFPQTLASQAQCLSLTLFIGLIVSDFRAKKAR